jgi:hypothetical protein
MSNQRTMESVLRRAEIECLVSGSVGVSENLHGVPWSPKRSSRRVIVTLQDPPLPAKARSQVARFKVDSATWHPIRSNNFECRMDTSRAPCVLWTTGDDFVFSSLLT